VFAIIRFGNAFSVGTVLASGLVPSVFLTLFGGVIGDRFPKYLVMLVSDFARMAAYAALALITYKNDNTIWHYAILYAIAGIGGAFFRPAASSIVPEIVEKAEIQRANATIGVFRNIAMVLGPLLAGIMIARGGPGLGLATNSFSFLISAISLTALTLLVPGALNSRRTNGGKSVWQELTEGWEAFSSRGWIVSIVFWASLFQFFVIAPFEVLGPIISKQFYGGAQSWAYVMAAFGAGSIVGAASIISKKIKFSLSGACVGLITFAGLMFGFAMRVTVLELCGLAFLSGSALSIFGVVWATHLQTLLPREILARVNSYDILLSIIFYPLGLALTGFAAQAMGSNHVLISSAIFAVVSPCLIGLAPAVQKIKAEAV
jgi:MFS family permease